MTAVGSHLPELEIYICNIFIFNIAFFSSQSHVNKTKPGLVGESSSSSEGRKCRSVGRKKREERLFYWRRSPWLCCGGGCVFSSLVFLSYASLCWHHIKVFEGGLLLCMCFFCFFSSPFFSKSWLWSGFSSANHSLLTLNIDFDQLGHVSVKETQNSNSLHLANHAFHSPGSSGRDLHLELSRKLYVDP